MATIGDLYRLRDTANALYAQAVKVEEEARLANHAPGSDIRKGATSAVTAAMNLVDELDYQIQTADPFGDAAPSKRCSCRRK